MNKAKRAVFFVLDLIVMAGLVFIDRYTKLQAVGRLKDKEPYRLIPGVFEFRYLENRGAAFGMLQNQRVFFIVVGVIFMIFAAWMIVKLSADDKYRALRYVLLLIAAGAFGNLIDRSITIYVVDFIYARIIDFPIFNVADCYVTIGSFLLFFMLLFKYKDDELFKEKHPDDR
jgi:signal peptidase II